MKTEKWIWTNECASWLLLNTNQYQYRVLRKFLPSLCELAPSFTQKRSFFWGSLYNPVVQHTDLCKILSNKLLPKCSVSGSFRPRGIFACFLTLGVGRPCHFASRPIYRVYHKMCDIWHTPFLGHTLMQQAALLRADKRYGWFYFKKKKKLGHGQVQEQAQPGLQQVQVLCR